MKRKINSIFQILVISIFLKIESEIWWKSFENDLNAVKKETVCEQSFFTHYNNDLRLQSCTWVLIYFE